MNDRYLDQGEYEGAKSMLSAAALTYVAAMFATLMSMLRIFLMLIGSQRND
ncbi:MAG: zinc metallopeptidase [Coprobacillus sp.]